MLTNTEIYLKPNFKIMKPVNEKSLLHHLFDQMDKLDKGEIDVAQATAQSKLAGQAVSLYRLEIDRAKLSMELQQHQKETGNLIRLRELSSKGFDDTTQEKE